MRPAGEPEKCAEDEEKKSHGKPENAGPVEGCADAMRLSRPYHGREHPTLNADERQRCEGKAMPSFSARSVLGTTAPPVAMPRPGAAAVQPPSCILQGRKGIFLLGLLQDGAQGTTFGGVAAKGRNRRLGVIFQWFAPAITGDFAAFFTP